MKGGTDMNTQEDQFFSSWLIFLCLSVSLVLSLNSDSEIFTKNTDSEIFTKKKEKRSVQVFQRVCNFGNKSFNNL